jgi:tyrosine-protein phosphatase YwqE
VPLLTDLHCHVLPGVDDGPATMDDALGMTRQAAGDGIAVVCATPHRRNQRRGDLAPGERAQHRLPWRT